MQGGFFTYGLLAALAIALMVAALTDLRRRQIDNWLNAGIALSAPLFWLINGQGFVAVGFHIVIALVTFFILAIFFAMGVMGGGDVKLLSALALWIDPIGYVKLLGLMSVAGGVLSAVMLAIHLARKRKGRIAVPYGIAISFAGIWVIASDYLSTAATGLLSG